MKIYLYIFILIFVICQQNCFAQSQKGVWLTDIASKALDNRKGINKVVRDCKKFGIDNIYVVVWNRGHTLYPSDIMEDTFGVKILPRFSKFDFLKALIEEAHRHNIKVHAWFEFGFSSSYKKADGGHILRKKPHWKAIDNHGHLVSKNDFQWMNAFHPEVQDFLLSLIEEVLDKYDVDGIQGDDRLPANPSTAGYDSYTLSVYKNEHNGTSPPQDYTDANWIKWRAKKLDLFAKKIYETVKSKNPNTMVSMAPSIYPWSKEEYLQNWPTWVENGWVDAIIPQIYRYNITTYNEALRSNLDFVSDENRSKFIPGVLLKVDDYSPSESFLKEMIQSNRSNGLKDEVFFFYEGFKTHKSFFKNSYFKL